MHRVFFSFVQLALMAFVLVAITGTSMVARGASVEKVKGKSAIVAFDEGEEPQPGDKFFALEEGKRKALLEVVKFKNGKAVVKVKKGKVAEGMDVAAAGKKKKAEGEEGEETAAEEESTEGKPKSKRSAGVATLYKDMTIGALLGYSMDNQSVTSTAIGTQAMSGSGFSLKGFADIPVIGKLAILTRAGAEQFNVQSGAYKSEILYATLDLMLKYSFGDGHFVPFGMGGLGLHFPLSKSSNVLDVNRISSTTVFYGGGGLNYAMSGKSYIQATVEYGMFPPSNDVTTSFIAARFGMGFRW